jgi:hypothetical protein
MSANDFKMVKGNDLQTLPLSGTRNEFCNATKEELLKEGHKIAGDCPVCSAYGTRCLVAAHPSTPPAGSRLTVQIFSFLAREYLYINHSR